MLFKIREKITHENAFEQKKKNPGLNLTLAKYYSKRPSNNWALVSWFDVCESFAQVQYVCMLFYTG